MWWTRSTVTTIVLLTLIKPFHCISCSVKNSDDLGVCKLLSECKQVRDDILKQQQLPQLCGFRETQAIVCCPQKKRKPGDISKIKCKEYSSYAKNECGHKIVKRIIGGEFAGSKEFPHMALLGFEKKGSANNITQWRCDGIIISDRYILTVAQCLNTRGFDLKYVKVGVTDLNETDHQQEIRVFQTVPHPDYKPLQSLRNDIGLIKLEKPIELNSYARPVCLYTERALAVDLAVVTGWGVTEAGSSSNKLKKVELPFVSSELCASLFKYAKNGFDEGLQICAGTANKDSCQGDTGGPLQIHHEGDDISCMYDIVGISSAGAKVCGTAPSIYTRVSHYVQWIEDIVWPEK